MTVLSKFGFLTNEHYFCVTNYLHAYYMLTTRLLHAWYTLKQWGMLKFEQTKTRTKTIYDLRFTIYDL